MGMVFFFFSFSAQFKLRLKLIPSLISPSHIVAFLAECLMEELGFGEEIRVQGTSSVMAVDSPLQKLRTVREVAHVENVRRVGRRMHKSQGLRVVSDSATQLTLQFS